MAFSKPADHFGIQQIIFINKTNIYKTNFYSKCLSQILGI